MDHIEIEKKREKDFKEQIKTYGELLTNIRAALQSMNTILLCVKYSGKGPARKIIKNEDKRESINNDKEDEDIEGMDNGKEHYNY